MGQGYKKPQRDSLGPVVDAIQGNQQRVARQERPSGTNLANLVAQVKAAIQGISAQVTAAISAQSYTKAQIDSKVASPGAISPTSVASSGAVSGSTGTFPSGINSTDIYNHLVTYGGPYRTVSAHQDGTLGYAPSSQRFKQDITDWNLDATLLMKLRPVLYRYIADVAANGNLAALHGGLIAEEVDALGLRELVDYDDSGKPYGVNYALVAVALIKLVQLRAAQRSRQVVTKTLSAITLVQGSQTVAIAWDKPMADSDYSVIAAVTSPEGVVSSAVVYPVPGSRTPTGCSVVVRTIGVALPANQVLTVEGLHL